MPESLTWRVREDGSAEAAILSRRTISPASNVDRCADSCVVSSLSRATEAPDQQVSVENSRWKVCLGNVAVPLSPSLLASISAVLNLLSLPRGWNSYTAKPIDQGSAAATIELLMVLLRSGIPAPAVVPRINGSIQLQWHAGAIDVEVYIDSPSNVRFFAEDVTTGQLAEGPLVGRDVELKGWLERLSD